MLLDDWNRADIRFIQAVMELIDRQQYISWTLPKDWHIILTANPDTGDYLVNSIDNAQKLDLFQSILSMILIVGVSGLKKMKWMVDVSTSCLCIQN